MARKLRIEYPGALYHIINRGHRREKIFRSDTDREEFLNRLLLVKHKYKLVIHAYCLMDNHYHILLETPHGNLSTVMRHFNSSYANYFRIKYRLTGSIFQGRFKSFLVEKEKYLIQVSKYIHLNPVRAKMVKNPEDYLWSSYKVYKQNIESELVTKDFILETSGGYENYEFIMHTKSDDDFDYERGFVTGSDEFKDFAYGKLAEKQKDPAYQSEVPELRALSRVSASKILSALEEICGIDRKDITTKKRGNIYFHLYLNSLKMYTNMTLKEIGAQFNMSYGAVSDATRLFNKKSEDNPEIKELIDRVDEWWLNGGKPNKQI